MKQKVITSWRGNMQFESAIDHYHLKLEPPKTDGTQSEIPNPKVLMLSSLAGCTGMDIISILNKMRVELDEFTIHVEATLTDEHPKYYNEFHIIYEFKAKEPQADKYEKAVELSQEKYCGVAFMYRHFAKLTHEIKIIQSK